MPSQVAGPKAESNPLDKKYFLSCVSSVSKVLRGANTSSQSSDHHGASEVPSAAILRELSSHVDELVQLCSDANTSILLALPTTTPTTFAAGPTPEDYIRGRDASALTVLCANFRLSQERGRSEFTERRQAGAALLNADSGPLNDDAFAVPPVALLDSQPADDNDDTATAALDAIPTELLCTLDDVEVPPPFRGLQEEHLFAVLCRMIDFALAIASHVLQFVLATEACDAAAATAGGSLLAVDATSTEDEHGTEGFLGTPASSSSAMRPSFSTSSFDDFHASCRQAQVQLAATLMAHATTVIAEALLVCSVDARRESVLEGLDHFLDRSEALLQGIVACDDDATAPSASGHNTAAATATASSSAPHHNASPPKAIPSYHQQCVVAMRRLHCKRLLSQLYPFQRRLQMYLLLETPLMAAYLPLVFGRTSREVELRWFAEGFRTQHMRILANMIHNNRHTARAIATMPAFAVCGYATPPPMPMPPSPVTANTAAPSPSPAVPRSASSRSLSPPLADNTSSRESSWSRASLAAAPPPPPPADLFVAVMSSTRLDEENVGVAEWAEYIIRWLCAVSTIARNRMRLLRSVIREQ